MSGALSPWTIGETGEREERREDIVAVVDVGKARVLCCEVWLKEDEEKVEESKRDRQALLARRIGWEGGGILGIDKQGASWSLSTRYHSTRTRVCAVSRFPFMGLTPKDFRHG